jgi:N-acetylmuramoyl-L-alanine amidase
MAQKENTADLIGGVNLGSQDAQVQRAMLDMSTAAQIKDSLQLGGSLLRGIQQYFSRNPPLARNRKI